MAYNAKGLSVLGYANGFTLWHYASPDAAHAIDGAGYFNSAATMLRPGDFIFANAGSGAGLQHGIFVVTGNTGGAVDVANMTRFDATNSD